MRIVTAADRTSDLLITLDLVTSCRLIGVPFSFVLLMVFSAVDDHVYQQIFEIGIKNGTK